MSRAGPGLLPGGGALRVHGNPGCAGRPPGARAVRRRSAPGWNEVDGNHLLSWPRNADRYQLVEAAEPRSPDRRGDGCRSPDGHLAEEALHSHDPERALGHRLLRTARQPGGGAGRPDPVLGPFPPSLLLPASYFCGTISRSATATCLPPRLGTLASVVVAKACVSWHQSRLSQGRSREWAC